MTILFNDQDVVDFDIHFPITGAWTATLSVAGDTIPTIGSRCTVKIYDQTFRAHVDRVGLFADRLELSIVGGSYPWTSLFESVHKVNTTVSAELASFGYALDIPNTTSLPFWSYQVNNRGGNIQQIADFLGFNWRVRPSGVLQMRTETFPAVNLEGLDYSELTRDDAGQTVLAALNSAAILPGVSVNGDNVVDVRYLPGPEGAIRVEYSFNEESPPGREIQNLVQFYNSNRVFNSVVLCQVIKQNSDLTLDLLPVNDPRITGNGLQQIPIKYPFPGCSVQLDPGAMVMLQWENGQATRPYAALFDGSGSNIKIIINSDSFELGGAIKVALATLVDSRLQAILTWANTHTHATAALGPPVAGLPLLNGGLPLASTASQKLGTE